MERILVLRGGALGDFIVTLPALALLRERWPRARIELAGNATAAQLALARGLIDAAHSQHEARWAGLFNDALLPPDFAAWLDGFELVLNYWPDPDGSIGRRFPTRAGQQFMPASALPARAPAAAHYCEPL
ncbi:MAG: glycosyltransferase family 9 protein, partial [Opitutaceae bacterium]